MTFKGLSFREAAEKYSIPHQRLVALVTKVRTECRRLKDAEERGGERLIDGSGRGFPGFGPWLNGSVCGIVLYEEDTKENSMDYDSWFSKDKTAGCKCNVSADCRTVMNTRLERATNIGCLE